MTDIELHHPTTDLAQQMDFARAVAVSSLLPNDYRNKPENVLIAMGLGQSMGLSPTESLYRISVIQGKPTANAELIAASVRKAGHRLRVTGDDTTCTATVIRHDDPDHEFTVTRDTAWAKAMGLASKDNYKKQPGTMLQWRAITAVARLACSEALYGVVYTPDEMYDMRGGEPTEPSRTGREVLSAALASPEPAPEAQAEPVDVGNAPEVDRPKPEPTITDAQRKKLMALANDLGLTRDRRLAGCKAVTGRDIASTNDLTRNEARQVIDRMETRLADTSAVIEAELVDVEPDTLPEAAEGSV